MLRSFVHLLTGLSCFLCMEVKGLGLYAVDTAFCWICDLQRSSLRLWFVFSYLNRVFHEANASNCEEIQLLNLIFYDFCLNFLSFMSEPSFPIFSLK